MSCAPQLRIIVTQSTPHEGKEGTCDAVGRSNKRPGCGNRAASSLWDPRAHRRPLTPLTNTTQHTL
eukprot:4859201-Amphidinium_carterae.1